MTERADAIAGQPVTQRAWKNLAAHYKNIREVHLRQLFAADPKRGERLTSEAVGLYFDYSKNRITDETLKLLFQLARESRFASANRRDVSRRQDQLHRGPRRLAYSAARPQR